ncbi:MAG: OB-fold nucleic acid binding domain-containing protein, partial [Bryobacteraceae bacterium]
MALEDDLLRQRQERIGKIEALGFAPYGQAFEFTHTVPRILSEYGSNASEDLGESAHVRIAGRILTIRRMGKAGFLHLLQNGEKLQVYIKKLAVTDRSYELYELLDAGDIIGVEGYLFRTRTGELTVHAEKLSFLSKILLPMPEKWHGLEDVEIRYRQRYLDLIANPDVRKTFVTRSRLVAS